MTSALSEAELRAAIRLAVDGGRASSGDQGSTLRFAEGTVDLLLANRLGPLLARALHRGAPASAVPTPLAEDARTATTRALSALAALRRIAEVLDTARIRWLLWKGPALGAIAWGDPTARHFTDLDLLVTPRDLARASDALLAAGWRRRLGMSRPQQRVLLGGRGAIDLERSTDEPYVELHWRFLGARFPTPLRPAEVLDRAERVDLGGVAVRTPNAADTLLLHAVHSMKHGWSQAEEVATFARLAARSPDALDVLLGRDARGPGALALATGLGLLAWAGLATASVGPLGAPAEVVDARVASCVARMRRGDAAWRPDHGWASLLLRGPIDRIRYWTHSLLAPTMEEWHWIRLPDQLVGLYPVVRLGRLAMRGRREA